MKCGISFSLDMFIVYITVDRASELIDMFIVSDFVFSSSNYYDHLD